MVRFFAFFVLLMFGGGIAGACSSDFSCGIGAQCVKEPFKSRGVCMKTVDRYGTRTFDLPRTNSVGPRMDSGDCSFNTDCGIGFKCDRRYKVCVKR